MGKIRLRSMLCANCVGLLHGPSATCLGSAHPLKSALVVLTLPASTCTHVDAHKLAYTVFSTVRLAHIVLCTVCFEVPLTHLYICIGSRTMSEHHSDTKRCYTC